MNFKELIRKTLTFLHLDLTKNLKYDRLTKIIINRIVQKDSVCVDVGCHKGEILDLFLAKAPKGGHYCFEPIPVLYTNLVAKYGKTNHLFPYALAEQEGTTTFQFVKNAPAYSGLKKREYNTETPDIEEIPVEIKMLDNIIPATEKITLIKIDVEGAELGVLKGARQTLIRNKPFVIFECGLGASDYYGTKPEEIYDFMTNEAGLQISLLDSWLKKGTPLTREKFVNVFYMNSDYYFIAHA